MRNYNTPILNVITLGLLAGSTFLTPTNAMAACSATGSTTTCSAGADQTQKISGNGNRDGQTVLVKKNAVIDVGNDNAISLGNDANITLESGSVVTNNVTSGGGAFETGRNTIEFNSGGTLTIEEGAAVIKKGPNTAAEAINVHGDGNVITNNGLIQAHNSAAIWFQDTSATHGKKNYVDNHGTIERVGGGNVIGTSVGAGIIFENQDGANVIGDILFAQGDDELIFHAGSNVTGTINGGAGRDILTLDGAVDTNGNFANEIKNFEELVKDGDGQWSVSSSLVGFLSTTVKNGTLTLTGNNAGYNGRTIVETSGILEASAESLPTNNGNLNNIENDGLLRFLQDSDGIYFGQITGVGQVEKTGKGDLYLKPVTGDGNTYSGGTIIKQGTIVAAADNVLGAATGGITFDGGALRFDNEFDLSSSRDIIIAKDGGTIDTNGYTSTLEQGTTGTGHLTKAGEGTLDLKGDNAHQGGTDVLQGIIALDTGAKLSGGGLVNVHQDAGLGGYGTVMGAVNNGGTLFVADALPKYSAGSTGDLTIVGSLLNSGTAVVGGSQVGNNLIVNGDYKGDNGTLVLNTVVGADDSATDQLRVNGDTSGTTTVIVNNRDGLGAPTHNGIKIIDITGASNGDFKLAGDYIILNNQAVVGGAYAYTLNKNGIDNPADGDWYLRSDVPVNPDVPVDPDLPIDPDVPVEPIYQAGVPLYEAYPQLLLGMNGLPTLQQRVGNRYWNNAGNQVLSQGADAIEAYAPTEEAGVLIEQNGIWGRIEGSHTKIKSKASTSGTDYDYDVFKMQAGLDGMLHETEDGKLIGGVTVHYAHGKSDVHSMHGKGDIKADGYGFGGTLTWYGEDGFYLDNQAQLTWYNSDLNSHTANKSLKNSNDGFGYALSMEAGKRITIDENWSLTPQAQLVYSNVRFDSFTDVFGARVSKQRADSLQGRLGISADYQNSWLNDQGMMNRSYVYGIANLYNEFLNGTKVDVSGVSFTNKQERLWAGVGVGGSYNWHDDKYSIYGEGSVNTSLKNFGDSYSYKGTIGLRVKW